jgi:NADP-dependent 3-hydroxy acid dehydrogenase YdfG
VASVKRKRQIDSLLKAGVAPAQITVAGTSKGGYIAQFVSSRCENPRLNFVFVARRLDRINDLQPIGIHILELDVTREESMVAAVNRINQEQGRIDVLVNNAGNGSYGALEDVLMEEARYQMEVNVFGLARLWRRGGCDSARAGPLIILHLRDYRAIPSGF